MEGDITRNGNRFIGYGSITPLSYMEGRPHFLAHKYENEKIDNGGSVRPDTARRLVEAVESANTTRAIFDAWEDAIAAGIAEWKAGNYAWHRRVFRLIGAQVPPTDLSQIGLSKPTDPTNV